MLVSQFLRTRRARSAALTARRGFTLAELVVALLLFSIVGGGILALVTRQQRFYRSAADVMKVQGQLREGGSILPLDLRTMSTSDTLVNSAATKYNADIYSKNDWSIEFRRTFGSSMICAKRKTAPFDTITLLPTATARVAALSSWATRPVAGDSILILDDWTMVGPGDDRWVAYEIKDVKAVKYSEGCPWKNKVAGDSTPLLFAADSVRDSYKIALDRTLSPSIIIGAPVRIFRRVRYEIYQAGDMQWYLGYSDCSPAYTSDTKCSDVTPVSGPYSAYTGVTSENGIVFAYYDSLGNALATTDTSRKIARIDIKMRGVTANNVTRTGMGAGAPYQDSVVLSVGIRNRR